MEFVMCSEKELLEMVLYENIPASVQNKEGLVGIEVDRKVAAIIFYQNEIEFLHLHIPKNRKSVPYIERKTKNLDEEQMIKEIRSWEDEYILYMTNAEESLEKELRKEERAEKQKKVEKKRNEWMENPISTEERLHIQTQYIIQEIGSILEMDTWIARNDQSTIYQGFALEECALEYFPDFSLSKEQEKQMKLIDAIWFDKGENPIALFEVEISTGLTKGITRMLDSMISLSQYDIKAYIVVPKEREKQVIEELKRPIYAQQGFVEQCKVVLVEDLFVLYEKIKGLQGMIGKQVLDTISISFEKVS